MKKALTKSVNKQKWQPITRVMCLSEMVAKRGTNIGKYVMKQLTPDHNRLASAHQLYFIRSNRKVSG